MCGSICSNENVNYHTDKHGGLHGTQRMMGFTGKMEGKIQDKAVWLIDLAYVWFLVVAAMYLDIYFLNYFELY